MIALGIVQAIDDDGVYVLLPGSRGQIRGPYRSLSTVAVGTSVLLASTDDDGEQVVIGASPGGDGVVSVLAFGAIGDGVADDTQPLQAAISAASGSTVVFPSGYRFKVSGSLEVGSDTVIVGYGATLIGTTKTPILDAIMREDVRIVGLTFATEVPHTYTGGGSQRHFDEEYMWAGIHASGSRLVVRDCAFATFRCGVVCFTWDGNNRTDGECVGFSVESCEFDGTDVGVLVESGERVTLRNLCGSVVSAAGDPNTQSHLVYVSAGYLADNSSNVLIENIHGHECAGYVVQVRQSDNVLVSNISSHLGNGVLSMFDSTSVMVSGVVATEDTVPTSGSLYMDTGTGSGCADVTISDVSVSSVAPTPASGLAARFAGSRITASGLHSVFSWSSQSDSGEWYVSGAASNVAISAVTSVNRTNYGAVAVKVRNDCTAVHVDSVAAINCRAGVVFATGGTVTGSAHVNLDQIVNGSAVTSPYKVAVDTGVKLTTLGDEFAHSGTKTGFYGATPATKPTVTGSRSGNAALASLLTQLATLGLITDSSS